MLEFIRRRLAAKLTAGYLLVVVSVTAGMGILLTRQLETRVLQQLESSLATQARLMEQTLPVSIRLEDRPILQQAALVWAQKIEGRVTMIAADGTVIADSGVSLDGLPEVENHADRPEVQAALKGKVGRAIRKSATVGKDLFYVGVPVQRNGSVAGVLRVALPLTHVHELVGTVGRILATGLSVTVILILAVSGWLSLRITRPLAAVVQSAGRLSRKELSSRVSVRTRDEVGELGAAFNAMADQLEREIQELGASRSQIEGILQSMTEGVLAVGAGGEILLINPAAREILGIGPEVRTGRSFSEAVRSPEIQTIVQEIQKTGSSFSRDLTLYAPSERHLRIHAATYSHTPSGGGGLLVLHDITDLKHLENIRREFVANVSHELKTPLTAIQGAVETLLDGALNDASHRRPFVESIAEEATRLRRLVEDLLTLAQVESKQATLRRESIPIKPFLEAEIARHQALARAHQVSLTLKVPDGTPSLSADRNELAQAIGNLLENAIKYNRPSGQVRVKVLLKNGECHIEIEDTGIGIPPEDLPRIFERFYRVDKARSRETGGTGLGLSIVKHVVEAHGGSVSVESQPGRGSIFSLILPLS